MPKPIDLKRKRWIREPFSGISHAAGAALSVAGLVVLLVIAHGRPWHTVAFALYGSSLVLLYSCSALYHSLHVRASVEDVFKRLDHTAIYWLIAGSYAPLCLISLRGAWGWSIFGIEIFFAVVGTCATFIWKSAPDWPRLTIYLVMGWLIIIAYSPLSRSLPHGAFLWLLAGGIAYSAGSIVFATNKPKLWPGIFGAHDLWHVLVLGGSACQFVMVLRYLAMHV